MKKTLLILASLSLMASATAYARSHNYAKKYVQSTDTFAIMRKNLRDKLMLGPLNYDQGNSLVKTQISKLVINATTYQTYLEKEPTTYLWSDYADLKDNITNTPKHIYYSLQRLHTMALAWAYPSSSLYKDSALLADIKRSLDFLYVYALNENTSLIGNFWEWRIGAPQEYAAIVSILYEELSEEQIDHYDKAFQTHVRWFTNNGNLTYANQASICRNLLYMGILTGNATDIQNALNKAKRAFLDETTLSQRLSAQTKFEKMIVEQGDYHNYSGVTLKEGFYEDGTFIQHVAIPYIGSYGSEIIQFAAEMVQMFKGSGFEAPDYMKEILPTWIKKAYIPSIYKGEMMRMFMGRNTSSSHDPHAAAREIGLNMFETSCLIKDEDERQSVVNVCKEMYTKNSYYNSIYDGMDAIISMPRIDSMIAAADEAPEPYVFNLVLAAGDRIIHERPNFRLGISMSSNRIGKYEGFSGNNLKGWYTGDGMTYIYNENDRSHWKNYFSYVDFYRMPGTTVDVITRTTDPSNIALFDNPVNAQSWVGGVSLRGTYGAAGMSHVGAKGDLVAKKSWFMFDDEVVCIGAGITMSEDRNVETIVENRMSTQPVFIEEVQRVKTKSKEFNFENPRYVYLTGTGGYYFPQPCTLHTYITTNGYTEFYFNHGTAPKDQTYEYVLLPMKSKDETRIYAEHPDIEVLVNTDQIQAVREDSLGITGLNFWKAGEIAGIHSDGEACVMYQQVGDTLYLSVSDPTWKRTSQTLTISGVYTLLSADPSDKVSLSSENHFTTLTIDTKNRMGMGQQVVLGVEEPMGIKSVIANKDIVSYTIYDSLGRCVAAGNIGRQLNQNDIEKLPRGVYIAVYQTINGETLANKFMY
ncbi:MAG: polysaccharide lyase family 8 super-sandwich domain-containing protein [Bacteroidales bacterium]|nr:polysaccharide lyase family 8 super-sandwich domain-containing protein [Bacteroidales bacterium]